MHLKFMLKLKKKKKHRKKTEASSEDTYHLHPSEIGRLSTAYYKLQDLN